ncbi:MAG: hypothetical protein A2268_02915 [Candidatus Raymondbacteria bacterium RifOxyA12_full_50_37]|uniref:Carbohydrate kinase PfkB domain-containing protein n=1 Tax=Candidatus Raymondbacteria bacterium RIFOXYD12_FULL_49_13 TaxID=1817890 RepID=A0A1F7F984_UNCRA|nr:MAG: hypothetical protein A2248_17020 [Candidatus Raymondbacteria bacterium RIFOXYA2_FULL_49_16]OGJ90730.1 MAG: hypothetical protein A2268_02915 [Candidatus Raymondbacteria bacterium RifOxyA12_full_50_37]OGJ91707.1 MAG: hypothetical protein A2350_00325 [Candidatus Raymondbacteria bacterium RifOxyB12_full_50_8]OGJ98367.1 MAG: hypothetical protein A2453_08925 [Candidatus Raymondbacteria bacterium RIFOXYC2_FULL_50_21]OGK03092.1 MAG: hypothetical protein A2519_06755 [Candidatus Raymondbacteria b
MTVFDTILGTGGIGSGIIFRLKGNCDLGRNESRMATRVPQRDFCKLHIIMHYFSLLSRELGLKAKFFPVGAVGNDDVGQAMRLSMKESGMDLRHVRVFNTAATLFAVCYQFPDHTGGNITEEKSASHLVSPAMIDKAASLLRIKKRPLHGIGSAGSTACFAHTPIAARQRTSGFYSSLVCFR